METTLKMGLTPEDDFILRVVQLSELLAIRHCVFLMGPTGSGRSECFKVLAKAIQTGTDKPVNTYLEACNRKKVRLRTTYWFPILKCIGKLMCTTAAQLCLFTYGLAIIFYPFNLQYPAARHMTPALVMTHSLRVANLQCKLQHTSLPGDRAGLKTTGPPSQ